MYILYFIPLFSKVFLNVLPPVDNCYLSEWSRCSTLRPLMIALSGPRINKFLFLYLPCYFQHLIHIKVTFLTFWCGGVLLKVAYKSESYLRFIYAFSLRLSWFPYFRNDKLSSVAITCFLQLMSIFYPKKLIDLYFLSLRNEPPSVVNTKISNKIRRLLKSNLSTEWRENGKRLEQIR